MKYVDVILPLPIASTFTYSVPDEWEERVRIGMRVVVPFGKKKMYTAVVYRVHLVTPVVYEAKEIVCLLDVAPVLRRPQLKFWEWVSSYYQSFLGDVFQAAVPAGLKLESETRVRINPDFEAETLLSEKEDHILHALSDGKAVSVAELNKVSTVRNILPVLKQLLDKGAIEISEELVEKFRPKTETCVRVAEEALREDKLRNLFEELKRARKQLDLLMLLIDMSKCLTPARQRDVSKKELLEKSGASAAVLGGLVERGVVEIYSREIGRLDVSVVQVAQQSPLNGFQQKALDEIEQQFIDKPVVLLHGVTSSGKTELYIQLISKVLSEGKQVLYLVPEIALTTQLTTRLKRVFGQRLGVYHSKFSDAERVEIWNNMLADSSYDVIIGVRSSVFLPFRQLGLVIVDEEHETSYKQFEPAPRYHARNASIVLASMHGAKTLLGTATPSVETYFNATTGKYGLVELNRRFEEMDMPEIVVVDTKDAYRRKQMESHFSDTLLGEIGKALQNHEQVILFQNRRGYAPYMECRACAFVPHCKNCDVSLTVHKVFNTVSCHYCGYTETIPQTCPACGTPGSLVTKGFGTEKIEDEIRLAFPEARVSRMDLDTTRSKKSYDKIITDFEQHKVDILIGTQMVSKGLDFERVSLVGILNADNMLNFPDFRAHERAFQLMAQVSGRSGRKNKRGLVILQTTMPEHAVIGQVIRNDYKAMFRTQCDERKLFSYPPYFRLVQVVVRHKDSAVLNQAANQLAADLRAVFGNRVLGPNIPLISRIQNMYIKHILLKFELPAPIDKAKDILRQVTNNLQADPRFKSLLVTLDVDPM
ncbi:MAG TPA: primosomal protein N' [Paludibacter sp.]|nr:primosomal protein N' [Paludibacter sp.]